MPKKIVYCADGTWNDPKDKTNVLELHDALSETATQTRIYDKGVGNGGSIWSRLRDGATGGEALIQNVREGYELIARKFEPGDSIYLFGFPVWQA